MTQTLPEKGNSDHVTRIGYVLPAGRTWHPFLTERGTGPNVHSQHTAKPGVPAPASHCATSPLCVGDCCCRSKHGLI